MKDIRLPPQTELVPLARQHPCRAFHSGQPLVEGWLRTKALQQQEKRLSVTKVLLESAGSKAGGAILGYYTIAPGQVDCAEFPSEIGRKLPKRPLPVAIVAWLGVHQDRRGKGLGTLLLALALRDCHAAGQTFPFVAVILDCLDDAAKQFFQRFDFRELPGNPYRLYLSYAQLEAMLKTPQPPAE
jgi:GNAT superfamily N-acetyltransferase